MPALRLAKLAIALLVIGSLAACSVGQLSAARHIERAKEYQQKGNLTAAVIELKNALQQQPQNGKARWLLGEIYVAMGAGASAEDELQRAVQLGAAPPTAVVLLTRAKLLDGKLKEVAKAARDQLIDQSSPAAKLPPKDRAELLALQGNALLQLGKPAGAKQFYDKALTFDAKNPEARLGEARLLGTRGKLEEMRAKLEQLLNVSPNFAPAWSVLGILEQGQHHPRKAEADYTKAISLRFNNSDDLLRRSEVRIQQKNYKGAAQDIANLRTKFPKSPYVTLASGYLDLNQGKYRAARTSLQETINASPDNLTAYFYLGLAQAMLGELEQADQDLSRVLRDVPNSTETARALAIVRLKSRDPAGAMKVLEDTLRYAPNDAELLRMLAMVAMQEDKPIQSVKYLQRLVQQKSGSAVAHLELGAGLLMAGKVSEGQRELEHAARLNPSVLRAKYLLIESELNAKQYDKALTTAKGLLAKHPKDTTAGNLLALIHLRMGDTQAARTAFERVFDIDPGNVMAGQNLATLQLKDGKFKAAHTIYETILRQHPRNLPTLLAIAQLDAEQGRTKEMFGRLEYAVREHPYAWQARFALARSYRVAGKPARAIAVINEAKGPAANNPQLIAELGKAQLAAGNFNAAVGTFQRLVAASPNSASAQFLLAQANARAGDLHSAEQAYENALKLKPEDYLSQLGLASVFIKEQKLEQAVHLLDKLRKIQPHDLRVLAMSGDVAKRKGNLNDAAQLYEQAAKQAPKNALFVAELASVKWKMGDKDSSLKLLESWLEKHPKDKLILSRTGDLYLQDGRKQQALLMYKRLLKLEPNAAPVLNNIAWLLRDDDPKTAQGYAEKALRIAPNTPQIMDTLAQILLKQGQQVKGLRLLRDATSKAPSNLEMHYELARALADSGDKAGAVKVLRDILSSKKPFDQREQAQDLLKKLQETGGGG